MTAKFSHLALVAPLTLALACGGKVSGSGRGSVASSEFAVVKAARAELLAAREALTRAQAEARAGTTGVDALLRAQSTFDAAYTRDQKVLAAFLTVALNERPSDPETLEALGLYADAAVANARVILDRSGDGRQALETLESAEHPYRALDLPLPHDLEAAIQEARLAQATPPTATPLPPERPATGRHRRAGSSRR
jgi:hypothetical protein